MIPYAGYDPTENAPSSAAFRAYDMFAGLELDTQQIAHRMGIPEAKALRLINEARSAVIHRECPYARGGVA